MRNWISAIRRLFRARGASSLIEYTFLAALISGMAIWVTVSYRDASLDSFSIDLDVGEIGAPPPGDAPLVEIAPPPPGLPDTPEGPMPRAETGIEAGLATLSQPTRDAWQEVEFTAPIASPRVIVGPLTANGSHPAIAEIRNLTPEGFEIRIAEWAYLDGSHVEESVGWVAGTAGAHELPSGRMVVFGRTDVGPDPEKIDVSTVMADAAVFSHPSEPGPERLAVVRQTDISGGTARLRVQSAEAAPPPARRAVDWLAVERIDTTGLEALAVMALTELGPVTHAVTRQRVGVTDPDRAVDIAAMEGMRGANTAALRLWRTDQDLRVFVEEEQSKDFETVHLEEQVRALTMLEGRVDLDPDDGPGPDALVVTASVAAGDTVTLDLGAPGRASGTVLWGDGTARVAISEAQADDGTITHRFEPAGAVRIALEGDVPVLRSRAPGQVTGIAQWGATGLVDIEDAFAGHGTLSLPATLPAGITSLAGVFSGVTGTISGVETWDVSGVTRFDRLLEDAARVPDLSAWTPRAATSLRAAFAGTTGMNADLSGWGAHLGGVQDFSRMFELSDAARPGLAGWDVSGARTMEAFARGAARFDGDMAAWDVSGVEVFSSAFEGARDFSRDLSGWDVSAARDMEAMFAGALSVSGDLSAWCVPHIAERPVDFATVDAFAVEPGWGGCLPDQLSGRPIRLRVEVAAGQEVGFAFGAPGVVTVDWGDGASGTFSRLEAINTLTHRYGAAGSYEISVSGHVTSMLSRAEDTLVAVEDFGDVGLASISGAFMRHTALRAVAPLPPTVSNMALAFYRADVTPAGLSEWDVSNVISFSRMFAGARGNWDLSAWRPRNATTLDRMFAGARDFDAPLNAWGPSLSGVTAFHEMFAGAESFDRPLGAWDVSHAYTWPHVTHRDDQMAEMFAGATAFSGDLSAWCVPNRTTPPHGFAAGASPSGMPRWGGC